MVADDYPIDRVVNNLRQSRRVQATSVRTIPDKVDLANPLLREPSVRQLIRAQVLRRIPQVRHIPQRLERHVRIPTRFRVKVPRQRHRQARPIRRLHGLDLRHDDLDPLDARLVRRVVEVRVGVQEAAAGRRVREDAERDDAPRAGAPPVRDGVGRRRQPLGRAEDDAQRVRAVQDGVVLAAGLAVVARDADARPVAAEVAEDVAELVGEDLLEADDGRVDVGDVVAWKSRCELHRSWAFREAVRYSSICHLCTYQVCC